jgi:hypothetical protein
MKARVARPQEFERFSKMLAETPVASEPTEDALDYIAAWQDEKSFIPLLRLTMSMCSKQHFLP